MENNNELSEKLKKCEAERDDYLNGWKRARADFVNYKKDEGRRLEEAGKFLTAGLMAELINVLDSFAAAKDLPEGAQLIGQQLEELLKKFGLEPIAAEAGQKFDPALHEAVAVEEAKEEINLGSSQGQEDLRRQEVILEELQRGYKLNGRVIRASKVKITK